MNDGNRGRRCVALLAGLLLAVFLPGMTPAWMEGGSLQIGAGRGWADAGQGMMPTVHLARAFRDGRATGDPPPPAAPSVPYMGDYPDPITRSLGPAVGGPGTPAWIARSLDLYHPGTDATVHVVDQIGFPDAGTHRFYFWELTENFAARADGVAADYTLTDDPHAPQIIVDVSVPTDTAVLTLEYDRADGALAFEGLWYLALDTVWGPATITVHLPTDAAVKRYDGQAYATWLNPYTLDLHIPVNVGFAPFVVYETTSVPELYQTAVTPHFHIHLPSVYKDYNDAVVSLLENAYSLLRVYSGQDVNQLANQHHYQYYYPPGGWYWWGTTHPLGGGLAVVGGPSAVRASFVPYSTVPHTVYFHPLAAVSFHELGNGWWLLLHKERWLPPTLPWWINSEGHSGFLRSQAELGLGYCTDAQREHDGHFPRYLQCKAAEPPGNRCGELVEIMLISLRDRYGWPLLQSMYAGVQDGSLDLGGLSEQEKDDRMILFLSEQAGENLVGFFDDHGIFASAGVRESLSHLPAAEIPIVSSLDCPDPLLHYTPGELRFSGVPGQADPASQTVYVGAPVSWTVTISPTVDWLSVTRNSSSDFATLTLSVDQSDLPLGAYTASLVLTSASPLGNSPAVIPVTLNVWASRLLVPLILRDR